MGGLVAPFVPSSSEPSTGSPSRIFNRGVATPIRSRESSPPFAVAADDVAQGSVDGEGDEGDAGGTFTSGGWTVGIGAVRIGALDGATCPAGGTASDGTVSVGVAEPAIPDIGGTAGLVIVAIGTVVVVMPKPVP